MENVRCLKLAHLSRNFYGNENAHWPGTLAGPCPGRLATLTTHCRFCFLFQDIALIPLAMAMVCVSLAIAIATWVGWEQTAIKETRPCSRVSQTVPGMDRSIKSWESACVSLHGRVVIAISVSFKTWSAFVPHPLIGC